jgi:hypothetical protein
VETVLNLSARCIRQLGDEGRLPQVEGGFMPLVASVNAYTRYFQDRIVANRQTPTAQADEFGNPKPVTEAHQDHRVISHVLAAFFRHIEDLLHLGLGEVRELPFGSSNASMNHCPRSG